MDMNIFIFYYLNFRLEPKYKFIQSIWPIQETFTFLKALILIGIDKPFSTKSVLITLPQQLFPWSLTDIGYSSNRRKTTLPPHHHTHIPLLASMIGIKWYFMNINSYYYWDKTFCNNFCRYTRIWYIILLFRNRVLSF